MRNIVFFLVLLLTLPSLSRAGFQDLLNKATDSTKGLTRTGASTGSNSLSNEEISSGLIETLRLGAERAVDLASAPGGFLKNPAIHIPLPDKIQGAGNMLRRIGLGQQVDTFEQTMNEAAEKASKEAMPILGQAIKELTLDDAQRLWKGGDRALTDYFQQKTRPALYEKFKPVVHNTSQQVGVTRSYDNLVRSPGVQPLVAGSNLDLDHYVTDKALAGLFTLLAEQEKQIRTNPVARTTDLLKKLFGR
ncbi:MAG: hypothetical protein A2521_17145 [Deltaproteobacteria bacterium RIFOXYD12_FULL_57_12]|nr:MAG: hypothetical protein A2521_17145 [Deltaproteobacteria bacterium RIFOXYD12_FULL_57_12]